jgi:hypothetical protein
MATKIVKIKQYGREYTAPIVGYWAFSSRYILAQKPPIADLEGIRILQLDGSIGTILPSECLNYEELQNNLLD